MRIISKYKDYYDYVAHQYGGGDPKIIYNRKDIEIGEDSLLRTVKIFNFKSNLFFTSEKEWNYDKQEYEDSNLSLLVVNDKGYLLHDSKIYDFSKDKTNSYIWNVLVGYTEKYNISKKIQKDKGLKIEYIKNRFTNINLNSFCKVVGSPVFEIKYIDSNQFTVSRKIPHLGEAGFASIMSAEQLYQEIAFFIGNVLKEQEKIVEVSNNQKILQGGFDLKTSFRGKI